MTNQTIDGVPSEQMACIPVERCYDVRVKMIIAFNEAKKAGGDLDEALDAAYKSALRYSPNPANAEKPAPVAECAHEWRTLHQDRHVTITGCRKCQRFMEGQGNY